MWSVAVLMTCNKIKIGEKTTQDEAVLVSEDDDILVTEDGFQLITEQDIT